MEVHGGPSQPSQKAAYLDFAGLQYSKTLANHGHASLVKVAEGPRSGTADDAVVNQLSGITPLLDRHLSDPGKRFAILIERRRIADHKNSGCPGTVRSF